MKSFIQFLTEVNLGSYTDPRIFDLKRKLVDDMLENIPHKFFFNTMHNITIRSVSIDLRWKIVVSIDNDYTTEIDGGAKLSYDSSDSETLFTITLFCDRNRSDSDKEFEYNLIRYIRTNAEGNLIHEIKHMLDYLDGKFTPEVKKSVPRLDLHSTEKEISSYISHDVEKEPWLFSVISELKQIKQNRPDITFNQAIDLSNEYRNFIKHLRPSIRNKYKGKIVYFWYSNYEQDKRFNLKTYINSLP